MNHLYFIGGSTRSGKTTILNRLIQREPMIAVQTDAIRESVRKAITGESLITMSKLSFSGAVTFQRLDDDRNIDVTKNFSQKVSQDDLTWNAVAGLVNYYDGKGVDLVIEGMEITPERVKSLVLKDLDIKAAFVGITEDTDLNIILGRTSMKNGGDDLEIKERFMEEIQKSKKIAVDASKYGYSFFSFKNDDFDGYCNSVVDYLLG